MKALRVKGYKRIERSGLLRAKNPKEAMRSRILCPEKVHQAWIAREVARASFFPPKISAFVLEWR